MRQIQEQIGEYMQIGRANTQVIGKFGAILSIFNSFWNQNQQKWQILNQRWQIYYIKQPWGIQNLNIIFPF